METFTARKILSTRKTGSSWPLVIETDAGKTVVKLSGNGQGYGALVAEVVVADLAEKIGLPVPKRALVIIKDTLIDLNEDPELIHLLRNSLGFNLGLEYIPGTSLLNAETRERIADHDAAKILWLDWLTENPDRTFKNSNILSRGEKFWLIDHGAALGFQYNLVHLSEDSPAKPWACAPEHIFYDKAYLLEQVHNEYSQQCSYADFLSLAGEIPHEFLPPLADQRPRELIAAYLWKRLKSFSLPRI